MSAFFNIIEEIPKKLNNNIIIMNLVAIINENCNFYYYLLKNYLLFVCTLLLCVCLMIQSTE